MSEHVIWRPKEKPWHPPDNDEYVIYAFRALHAGVANEGQQKLFIEYLRYITDIDQMSYRPGEDGRRDTDFAEGKRFVGRELFKLLHPLYTPVAAKPKRPALAQQRLRGRKRNQDEQE